MVLPATACLAVAFAPSAHATAPESGGLQVDDPHPMVPPELLGAVTLNYPPEAIESGLHADVVIQVGVDTKGDVTDVTVLHGPPVFEAEARRAGKALRFAPATRDGLPVASFTVITFHFAPPDLQEIVVVGIDEDQRDPHASVTLDEDAIDSRAGQSAAEVVAQVPGVEVSRGTSATSKPIIRGQTERRILILDDGVRHESQKWGPDHAPEVDPFSAGSIRVVKGPAGARYGPDALGGVLLVTPPPLRDIPGVEGKALATGSLNGPGAYAALRLDAVPAGADRLSLRIEGNVTRHASIRTPAYVLGNTALTAWNLGAAFRYGTDARHIRVTYRHYDLFGGVFYGIRTSIDEFGVPPTPAQIDRWENNRFVVDRPRQDVTHDRATVHARTRTAGNVELEAIYAFQYNRRQEFESIQFSFEGPELDFSLYTHSLDVVARQPATPLGIGSLTGGIGAQGLSQFNVYRGATLLPAYFANQVGVFGFQRLEPGPEWAFEVGARVDQLWRQAQFLGPDIARQQVEGSLTDEAIEEDCREGEFRLLCPDSWTAASASLGGVWQGWSDRLAVKLDLSSASRFPSADEQYLIGTAPTFPVYAIGDLDLGVETTYQAQLTLGLRLPWLQGEVSGFASRVANYIYFAPDRDTPLRRTIVGEFPQYRYQAIAASFLGADGAIDLGRASPIGLRLTGAVVRATDRATGEFLVGIPPTRGTATVEVRPPVRYEPKVSVTVEGAATQSGPPLEADLLPPPPGYVLLSASAGIEVPVGTRRVTVALDGFNLLDARYREYASLLRYYADFPGRDLRLRVGVRF